MESGDGYVAVQQLERCLAASPSNPELNFSLGTAYSRVRNQTAAGSYLRAAAKLDPDNAEYRRVLGVFYRNSNLLDKALEELDFALKLDPFYAPAWYDLASIYATVKNRDRALACLDQAVLTGGAAYVRAVKSDQDFDWLKRDARYLEIIRKTQ
jgi:tetratricopeptide (TPR) repeat protein